MENNNEVMTGNFIHDFIEEDIAEGGRYEGKKVHTRFPPEPNGYLHIGHAKAVCINFATAEKFGGICNLRMDDTNPTKEDVEYVDAIKEDIAWLGFHWDDRFFYASEYFEQMYDFAVELIQKGLAYVCELTPEQMREYRGDTQTPAKSPYRDRPIEESLDLFARMRAGEFPDGSMTLRAKIDLASGNFNMRDPVIYRINRMHHHRTGDQWCIYPMYDFAHPIEDALEGITHSLCSLEFEAHRPLYDWVIENISAPCKPRQIEFARLGINNTVMRRTTSAAGTTRECRRSAVCADAAIRRSPSVRSSTRSAFPRSTPSSNTASLSTACATTSTRPQREPCACCVPSS